MGRRTCARCRRWTAPPDSPLCEMCMLRRRRLWADTDNDDTELIAPENERKVPE